MVANALAGTIITMNLETFTLTRLLLITQSSVWPFLLLLVGVLTVSTVSDYLFRVQQYNKAALSDNKAGVLATLPVWVIAMLGAAYWSFVQVLGTVSDVVTVPFMQTLNLVAFAALPLCLHQVLLLVDKKLLSSQSLAQLKKQEKEIENKSFKHQFEQHFIYNSLNTLSCLLENDPSLARHFNEKLLEVYKHALVNNEKEQISLQEELDFLSSYCSLLQIRHNNAIKLHIAVHAKSIDDLSIVPFSLQTLIENAYKHNKFSNQEPLLLSIKIYEHHITVSNPVKLKKQVIPSTKIGLKNLNARYQLAFNKTIHITSTPEKFVVKVPLIKQLS